METRCQACGAAVGADQAFCSKCGAVVGMREAESSHDEGWDLAATMMGQQKPSAPAKPRQSAERAAHPPQAAPARKGGNAVLLAVIGFVAVLALGGLVILLLYMNSRG
jgi:ferric-dicitrate binding protein FerR (iron transport regulator)